MFNWKFVIIICMLYEAAWAFTSEPFPIDIDSVDMSESKPLSSEEIPTVSKGANWQPICQEVHHVNNIDSNTEILDSDVVYVPQEIPGIVISPGRVTNNDDKCAAPNDRGLKTLLIKAKSLLPHDKLKNIIKNSIKDPEVQRVKALVTSNQFREKVGDLIESSHFIILRDYVCRALNLDVKYYVQFVRSLIAVEKANSASQATTIADTGRPGIRGLIQDLSDALPKQQLTALYERLLNTDEYLLTAIRRMQSVEFRQLLRNLTTVKEFNQLKEALINVGVPLQGVKELIDTALGWKSDELIDQELETNI